MKRKHVQNSQLRHIYWLGGSPCTGKSSASIWLSGHFQMSLYQVDDALGAQMERIEPGRHPALSAWLSATCDERWLKSVDELLADAIGCNTDHFGLIREDLTALPQHQSILVEGTALLPHLLADLDISPDHALWMTPTPAFQVEHYRRRPWIQDVLAECSDRQRAFKNWMERDIRFAEWVAAEADRHGYTVIWVDGNHGIEANAIRIADHFRLKRSSAGII